MSWLLRNFRAKLLAIGVAASLWTVVAYSETEARTYLLPIEQSAPPPPNLVLVSELPQVKVEVVASTEELKVFDAKANLHAKANFGALRKGLNTVSIQLDPPDPNVTVRRVTPPSIQVPVDERDTRSVEVKIEPVHEPASGFRVASKTAKPDKVTVEGPKSKLDGIQAIVTVDIEGQQGPIFESPKPVPVEVRDGANKKVDKLKVTPPEVQVSITIQSITQPGVKAVIANFAGQPAAGYRVKNITVTPQTVNVTGTPAKLNALTELQADPVDISGQQTDVIRTVNVRPPPGLEVTPRTVQVHVFIEKNPQVPPPPTPTPTPTPTPPPP